MGYLRHMPNYAPSVSSKLPTVGTTIFTVMSALAREHKAVNLSQGFPDFEVDRELIKRVNRYMKKGHNQYAPMAGAPELRTALSQKIEKTHDTRFDPETEITVTAGATQAIFTAITALIKEGDEVMLFSPAYDCYAPPVELAGGKAVYVPLRYPDYSIPWDEVQKRLNRKTRMIIINTPHNPSGSSWTAADMDHLAKLTAESDVMLLSDEVYEHIIFDGVTHQSPLMHEGLRDRTLVVGSFGKTFHATGWKMGYIAGPESLIAEFRKVHQYNVFCCNTPVQLAIADHLEDEGNYLGIAQMYEQKRDYFLSELKGSRFHCKPSSGSYFQLLSYADISDEPDTEMALRLTKEHKLASIPISPFYHEEVDDRVLRFCFAKEEKTLKKATNILKSL